MTDVAAALRDAFGEPTHPDLSSVPLKASDQFIDANNNPAGIRAPHAIQHVRGSSRVDAYGASGGGGENILALADVPEAGYTALLRLVRIQPMGPDPVLTAAWRFYGLPADATPSEAFAQLIERYGLEVKSGSNVSKFIAQATLTPAEAEQALTLVRPDARDVAMEGMVKGLPGGRGAEVSWAFAVDNAAYAADVAAARK